MANKYFTQLTQLTAGSMATGDAFAVEDISAGETKYITASDVSTYLSSSIGSEGWTAETQTLEYVSGTQFKVTGVDVTAKYPVGAKIKFTQTTAKYFYAIAGTFNTNSTITVANSSDYTIANAAISSPYYSYQQTPQGFPSKFAWTTTYGGFSTNPVSVNTFFMMGKAVYIDVEVTTSGTSNATNFTLTAPIAASQAYTFPIPAPVDSGSVVAAGYGQIATSGTITLSKSTGAAWTNSGGKYAAFQAFYFVT
jgi:hypothetical protein